MSAVLTGDSGIAAVFGPGRGWWPGSSQDPAPQSWVPAARHRAEACTNPQQLCGDLGGARQSGVVPEEGGHSYQPRRSSLLTGPSGECWPHDWKPW